MLDSDGAMHRHSIDIRYFNSVAGTSTYEKITEEVNEESVILEPCEVPNCQSNRKVVGRCTYGFCYSGKCGRHFCQEHNGKN